MEENGFRSGLKVGSSSSMVFQGFWGGVLKGFKQFLQVFVVFLKRCSLGL